MRTLIRQRKHSKRRLNGLILGICYCGFWAVAIGKVSAAPGELELSVVDAKTSEPIAVQFRLTNQRGRSVRPKGPVADGLWQAFDGSVALKLPAGHYQFEMRRGPEFRQRTGHFLIRSGAADNHQVTLPRVVDMRREGWWSTDLDFRPKALVNVPLLVFAGDLDVLTLVRQPKDAAWPASQQEKLKRELAEAAHVGVEGLALVDQGAEALVFGDSKVIDAMRDALNARATANRELPSVVDVVQSVSAASIESPDPPRLHRHLTRATCRDLPTWIARQQVDSIGILHGGEEAPWESPRDTTMFPNPHGLAHWSQHIYFQLLESGHQIPPAAGSGSNASAARRTVRRSRAQTPRRPRSLGDQRVYVHCGEGFSESRWWDRLSGGHVMVTNGPLLRVLANGEPPGTVFRTAGKTPIALELAVNLATQHKIPYLEVIQNGHSVQQVRLEDWKSAGGRLPDVVFSESGWCLIRTVAESSEDYVAAVAGPFYIEFTDRPRISRSASQFFLDWVYRRAREIASSEPNLKQRQEQLRVHRVARDYWKQRVAVATVD